MHTLLHLDGPIHIGNALLEEDFGECEPDQEELDGAKTFPEN